MEGPTSPTPTEKLFTVELPDWSLLKQDIEHHPHISMGYASVLIDLDNDAHLDWVVGAPTAGSGNNPDFPEQAGWVGWFEQNDREWVLRQEWTGAGTFDHFGWSLGIQQTDTQRTVFAGAPGSSTVSSTLCSQKGRKVIMIYLLGAIVVGVVGIHVVQYRKDYLGTWNGHQIQIVYKYLSFDILVDDEVIIENAMHSKLTLQHTFPLYGEQNDPNIPRKDSNRVTVSIDLMIGKDVVPLIQAPQNFFGNTVRKQLPELKGNSPLRLGITDPRLPKCAKPSPQYQSRNRRRH